MTRHSDGGGRRVTPGAAVLRGWECERRRRGSGPATTAEVDGRGLMAGPARDAAASRRTAGSTPARSAASTLGFGGRGLEDASLGADQRSASAPRWPWRLLPGQARRGAEPGNAPAGSWPATGEPAITAAARPRPGILLFNGRDEAQRGERSPLGRQVAVAAGVLGTVHRGG